MKGRKKRKVRKKNYKKERKENEGKETKRKRKGIESKEGNIKQEQNKLILMLATREQGLP